MDRFHKLGHAVGPIGLKRQVQVVRTFPIVPATTNAVPNDGANAPIPVTHPRLPALKRV